MLIDVDHLLPSGVVNYLSTEVSTSRQKKFSLVMFVDTPGLVDGDMNYPFNVDNAIVLLGMNIVCVEQVCIIIMTDI